VRRPQDGERVRREPHRRARERRRRLCQGSGAQGGTCQEVAAGHRLRLLRRHPTVGGTGEPDAHWPHGRPQSPPSPVPHELASKLQGQIGEVAGDGDAVAVLHVGDRRWRDFTHPGSAARGDSWARARPRSPGAAGRRAWRHGGGWGWPGGVDHWGMASRARFAFGNELIPSAGHE